MERFDGSQLIPIISSLIDFHMACSDADVPEGAAVWLFPYLLRSSTKR